MTNELEALKVSYESLKMTPEEIADDRGLEIAAVKAGLMTASSQYRKDCGQENETSEGLNFNDDDLRRVNDVIREVALSAEDDGLRLKAAMYIRDDKKGRKEINKGVAGVGFNILQFNTFMQKSRSLAEQVKSGGIVEV